MNLVTLKTEKNELLGLMCKRSYKDNTLEFVMIIYLPYFTIKQYNSLAEDIIKGMCSFDITCKDGICSTDGLVGECKWDKELDTMTLNVRSCGMMVGEKI